MSLLTTLTYALPHRALSAFARALAQSRRPWLKQWLIDSVIAKFGVDMGEAAAPDPREYPTFNAFFTRALRDGARTPDADPRSLLMPADGFISQCGAIGHAQHGPGHIFQAKGRGFSTEQLLADASAAARFEGGVFATVYLSPRDYHRVHMPWNGTLRETVHVPGRLFSVGTAAVDRMPGLFARNERLVCHFDCDLGPMALVMVGALLVSGVETVWGGVEIPPYASEVIRKDYGGQGIALQRFAEMARFNYGSTVIVLLPPGVATLDPRLTPQVAVKLGQRLAILR